MYKINTYYFITLTLLLSSCTALDSYSLFLKEINVKGNYWDTNTFPEEKFFDKKLDDRVGISFSGGGTRSASATLGELRGLKNLNLLDRVDYISAVSGGAWASVPYTFLPDTYDDETFLGKYIPPEEIADSNLDVVTELSLAKAISNSKIEQNFILNAQAAINSDAYAKTIGEVFLSPWGLNENNKYITLNKDTLKDALNFNPGLNEKDFYLPQKRRPFLILAATLLSNSNYIEDKKLQAEYTPYYSGVRRNITDDKNMGGTYLPTYAYNSYSPKIIDKESKKFSSSVKRIFNLSYILGSTGAAPQETVDSLGANFIGFPYYNYWNDSEICAGENACLKEHADGGVSENLGIMPLLARKLKKIMVFINTDYPFKLDKVNTSSGSLEEVTPELRALFIKGNVDQSKTITNLFSSFSFNVIFENGYDKYRKLISAFSEKQNNGEALVYCDNYNIIENKYYKVSPYTGVNICWFYNEKAKKWEDNFKNQKYKKELLEEAKLKNFPHYDTFFNNFPYIINLEPKQVNLLSNITSWNIVSNKNLLECFFNSNDVNQCKK